MTAPATWTARISTEWPRRWNTQVGRRAAACVLLGLAVRLAYWILVTPRWTPDSDADQYLQIARNLAAGDGYSLVFPQLELHATAFRPPVYPVLLAVPNWIFGPDPLLPSRLFSVLLGLAVIWLTVVFVARIATVRAALVAGLAVALYPPLIANDTVTLTEPLALALLLGLLIALDARRPLACGLATGLLLLTRPNAYALVLIVGVVLWRSLGWRRVAAFVGVLALIVAPWMIRNQIQVGSFRLTTSEGFNLAAIYSPASQETGGFVDPVFSDAYADDRQLKLSQFDEAKWNDRLTELGIESFGENPGYLLDVFQRNLLSYFELRPSYNDSPERLDGRNPDFRSATLPLFYVVTLLGLGGLVLNWRKTSLWPGALIVAQFAILSMFLVAPPRLRAPFDLLMCIGLGLLFDWAATRRSARRQGVQYGAGAASGTAE